MPVFTFTPNSIGFSGCDGVAMSIEPPDELLGSSAAKFFEITVWSTISDGNRSSCTDWRSGSGLGTGASLKSVLL
jgi:hypothetical protein